MSKTEKSDKVDAAPVDFEAFMAKRAPSLTKTVSYYTVNHADAIREAMEAVDRAQFDDDIEAAMKHAAEAQRLSSEMAESRETVTLRPISADVLWDLTKRESGGEDTRCDLLAASVVDPEWSADEWRKFAASPGLGPTFFEILGAAQWLNGSVPVMPDFSPATSALIRELGSGKS